MCLLRLIKGVARRDRLRDVEERAELKMNNILTIINLEETQLQSYGYMQRMHDTYIPKK